jgi:hypothetical protein
MRYSSSPSSGRRMPDTPMHEIFLESFLDTSAVARSDWYRHAAKAKLSSPILYNSFLFVSASYFGSSVGDSRIVLGAQKVYVNVLRELQRALLSPSSSKSQWTLFTVILAVQYEVAWSHHTRRITQTDSRLYLDAPKYFGTWYG